MSGIDEYDCAQLLRHTFGEMREIGLADLADRVIAAIPLDMELPSRQLLFVLDALAAEMRLQDGATARTVVERLRPVVHTDEDRPPDSLWLDLAPAHEQLYGVERVDLTQQQEMGPLLEQFAQLREDVRESLPEHR